MIPGARLPGVPEHLRGGVDPTVVGTATARRTRTRPRRPVGVLTPDSVRPCDDRTDGGLSVGADPSVRGDTAPAVLQAFAATTDLWRMGLTASGWVELDEPDGTVSYGHGHDDRGWGMLVEVVPDEDGTGWHFAGWRRSAC